MKYLIALILGLVVGAALFFVALVYNPFSGEQGLSPIAVSDSRVLTLAYSGNPSESIAYSNDGESRVAPYPEKILQLWEAPIRQTSALVTSMKDGRNQTIGVGIKFSSLSEKTRLIEGRAMVDSVWYIYLPGRGGLFVEQTENHWDYFRNVIWPAYRSSAKTWAGAWLGNITSGPGALGTAYVSGSSGEFTDYEMLAVESLSVKAWRVSGGPVAAEGRLSIELPALDNASDDELDDEAMQDLAGVVSPSG